MKKTILFIVFNGLFLSALAQELTRRASLGFTPVAVDSATAHDRNLDTTTGLIITELSDGGTFAKLDAESGDILIELNGQPIQSIQDLLNVRNLLREGDVITATIIREGKSITLQGQAEKIPYETSPHSEVIYGQFNFKDGRIRTIVNKPNKKGKQPAIFFIPGYTCSSIDNMHSINPYRQLLDSLVALDYAVFRMEKPGVGDNEQTGDCRQLGFDNELQAYIEGYKQLANYDFIDQENIFIWGHSMGGIHAPLVAQKHQPKGVVVYGIIHDTWTEYLLRMVRYQKSQNWCCRLYSYRSGCENIICLTL